jgi:sterol desaturase/sphingolipid hydroxylase (fatty acid hydroxylase superfamily)
VHHHAPRSALGRRLRELHMRHHFQDDERGFGISAPYWDTIFGTSPRRSGESRVAGQPTHPGDPATRA